MISPTIPIHDLPKSADELHFEIAMMEKRDDDDYDSSVPHRHSYYEIFYFASGGGTHEIDFREYHVAAGSLHFVAPGQVHHVKRAPKAHGFVLLFSRDFYCTDRSNNDILSQLPFFYHSSQPILSLPQPGQKLVHDLIESIRQEHFSSNRDKDELIRSYLNILFIHAKRFYENEYHQTRDNQTPSSLIRKFLEIVETKFSTQQLVADYAEELCVSQNHLTDSVQKHIGKTPNEIIHERIVLEAKRLLFHSDASVKEIATQLGFEDPTYFSRFFTKHAGVPPVDFRKENREKYM